MQRPRRTSEFNEELGTAVKRQSRTLRRGTNSEIATPQHGTAQKYNTRRAPSNTGSATRPRSALPTPQKTPMHSARVLFTAEKVPRGTAGTALHNDKKWIQDQTQRITEVLKRIWFPGCGMIGITEDFFSRPNCLKQMSIKQFVSIINCFLHYICGSRFTVGSNHVDDIFNILQKLNYPYQVNKSWLKTPNTNHSFGNVIVLFDFLVDFAPATNLEFPLQELKQTITTEGQRSEEPDLEFKAELLQACSESFKIWDKRLDDEYKAIQRRLADLLVQKRCGIAGLDDLKAELDRLYKIHEQLKKELQAHISSADEREYERLEEFMKNANNELQQLNEQLMKDDQHMKQIYARKQKCLDEIARFEKEIAEYELAINNQLYNKKQWDAGMEKLKLLRLELQGYVKTVDDLEERDHRQQVQLSVAKKNATEKIVKLNAILRDVTFTLSISEPQNQIQINVNADASSVEHLIPKMKGLESTIKRKIKEEEKALKQYDTETEGLSHEIATVIEPRLKAQESTLSTLILREENLENRTTKEFEELYTREKILETFLKRQQTEIENYQKQIQDGKNILQQLVNECEEMMSKAEEDHSAAVQTRTEFIDKYELELQNCTGRLKELEGLVLCDQNDKTLAETDNDKTLEAEHID